MAFITFETPVGPEDRIVGREPPPGRDLADSILQAVQAAGLQIVEPLAQHDSYGWSFTVRGSGSQWVWCMLQLSDEWLLITHSPIPLLQRLRRGADVRSGDAEVDSALLAALSSMPQVSNVRSFRSEEDLREGRPGQP